MTLSGVIIILTLLQSGKSDGLSAAFTGSGDLNLFAVQKERGPEKFSTEGNDRQRRCGQCSEIRRLCRSGRHSGPAARFGNGLGKS